MYYPDLPVSMAFGGLIVASNMARHQRGLDNGDQFRRRTFWQALVYGAVFHCPDSMLAFIYYPDWNLGYFVPWEKIGWPLAIVGEVVLLLLLFAGRKLAHAAVAQGRGRIWFLLGACFLVFGAVLGSVWDRYLHVGTYAEYHAGQAVLGSADPAYQMFVTVAGLYLNAPLAVLQLSNIAGARGRGEGEKV